MRFLGHLEEENFYVNYDYPSIDDEAQNMSELMDLFLPGYEDIPFTPAEEEMLPYDSQPA